MESQLDLKILSIPQSDKTLTNIIINRKGRVVYYKANQMNTQHME